MSKWPAIIMLFMLGMNVVIQVSKHGQARDPFDGPTAFLSASVTFGLLYWGGFFTVLTQ